MANLHESQNELQSRLHASETALIIAQYEISDRNAREDLLKRRNLDLETNLRVYEGMELENDGLVASNEELKRQTSLLLENLQESAARITTLEKELGTKDEELQQLIQDVEEIGERLQNAESSATSVRNATQVDFVNKCGEITTYWSTNEGQKSTNIFAELQNKLRDATEGKETAESDLETLRLTLERFRERDIKLVSTVCS